MNGQWSPTSPTAELVEEAITTLQASNVPASSRNSYYPSNSYAYTGFRVTLYL